MNDVQFNFITLDDVDDDDYVEIPCTDINNFEFISLKQHYSESGINA